jgi:hypothetical protein
VSVVFAGNRVEPIYPSYTELYKLMPGKEKLSDLNGMIYDAAASCIVRGAGSLLLQ